MDVRVTALLQTQHGVLTRAQLREAGLSRATIRHLTDSGQLIAITDYVLRLDGTPIDRGQRLMAAVLDSGPGAVLSFRSAARWWRVNGCQLDPIHVARMSRSTRDSSLATIHPVRRIPPCWTTILDGVPIARPELVALHLFATNPYQRAETWTDRMWSLRLLDGRSVTRLLSDLGQRGRNGTAGLREYLGDRGDGYVPPASNVESRTLQILRSAGIEMIPQVDLGGSTWTGRVDFSHVELPQVLEVQSEMYHSALVDRRADMKRMEKLRSDGLTVVEVTDTEVFQRPGEVIRRVSEAILELQKSVNHHR